MKLSIVIPCYNEEKNIPIILDKFSKIIGAKELEVILVNNGSTDNSQKVIESLLPQYPFARTFLVDVNKGYGYGIIQGLKQASGAYIGWTHADLQTDPNDVLRAYEIIEENENEKIFIKGKRIGRPYSDEFFTRGMSLFESLYLGAKLNDINAQPTVFSRHFFDEWHKPPFDFSLDLYAYYLAHTKGLILKRFPVHFPERLHGSSTWNTGWASKWKFIKRTIDYSVKLKRSGIR